MGHNRTGTLPAVGPFHPSPKSGVQRPKPQPERSVNRHVAIKCGDKPGNRRVILAPELPIFGHFGFGW